MKKLTVITIILLFTYLVYSNFKSNSPSVLTDFKAPIETNEPTEFSEAIPTPELAVEKLEKPEMEEEIIDNQAEKTDDNLQSAAVDENVSIKKTPFDEQDIDEEWAYEFSDKIFYYFLYHPELTHLDIKEVDCRETICEVDIAVFDDEPIMTTRKVMQAFKENKSWEEHPFFYDSEPIKGVIRIQIDRYKN